MSRPTTPTPPPVDLDALGAIVAAATAGPWRAVTPPGVAGVSGPEYVGCYVYIHSRSDDVSDETIARWQADARAIVALRNAWPAIEREMRALREVAKAAARVAMFADGHGVGMTFLNAALDRLDALKGGE